jgi:hypothetical protein
VNLQLAIAQVSLTGPHQAGWKSLGLIIPQQI